MADKNNEYAEEFIRQVGFSRVVTLPGDDITSNVSSTGLSNCIKLGRGITLNSVSQAHASTVGVLSYRSPACFWIESSSKRYYPRVGDQVVGVIDDKGGEFYTVNIFSRSGTILNRLAFDGATKRNKPELKHGDVLYCRVLSCSTDTDTELSCTAISGSKKEWTTGETIYGPLSDGLIVNVSITHARSLLHPENVLLNALSRHFIFEVAIGVNGCIWFRAVGANRCVDMVVIRNSILNAQQLNDDAQIIAMVDQLAERSSRAA